MNNTWSIIPGFPSFLQEAWQKSNFSTPTAIQEQAVPVILEGKDVVAESPTGTGKTLAYLLPGLQQIDVSKKEVQLVILASSQELVMQLTEEVRIWSEGSGIGRAALIGGANMNRQLDKLKKKPHVVVGTPGRIVELIQMKKLKMHEVKIVVLDEADQLLQPEHEKAVDVIIHSTKKDRQLVVFSATLSAETENKVKERMKEGASVIRIKADEAADSSVEHAYIVCEEREKIELLRKLMNVPGLQALAFSNQIEQLNVYAAKLQFHGKPLGVLHSETTKQEREAAVKGFRNKKFPLLLATDVASRGLDIKGLTHVIQLDMPQEPRQYLHRAGRTGRAGAGGTVLSLVTRQQVEKLLSIGKKINVSFEKKRLYKGKLI
ncbi:Superfamily II DNA and RNA helicase [Evansella caseinilytica]|uniref:Superfamily II DNA and RNA helicase n=1 Tax=Evansella caseinilytica TaxID=1503961 RepID=A0A1H3GS06_9BACI|nr:DEAD/DEAH box helicase [Evansella caseinilytica]SDY05887.1 Superfamily II DNA and RNA helicase [Evansella caseinilytica]